MVVVRDVGQLTPGDAKRLVEYLEDPLPTTALVLVAGGGTLPQALSKAVGASGEVVDTSVGTGRARTQWLADHLKEGPVRLDGPATARPLRAPGGGHGPPRGPARHPGLGLR